MERLKDFFYNKNDIVVALLILAVAVGVIFFRVSAIMDYPKELADEQAKQVEENAGFHEEVPATESSDNSDDSSDEKNGSKSDSSSDSDSDKESSEKDSSDK